MGFVSGKVNQARAGTVDRPAEESLVVLLHAMQSDPDRGEIPRGCHGQEDAIAHLASSACPSARDRNSDHQLDETTDEAMSLVTFEPGPVPLMEGRVGRQGGLIDDLSFNGVAR